MDRQTVHDSVRERIAQLEAAIEYLGRELDHAMKARDAAATFLRSDDDLPADFTGIDFMGQAINRSLIQVAERNGGRVVARDAAVAFVDAGRFASRDLAATAVNDTLQRSRDFVRMGTGVYARVYRGEPAVDVRPSAVLLPEVRDNPDLTTADALALLQEAGYDFGQGNPPRIAANALAWCRRLLDREAEEEAREAVAVDDLPF